LNPFISDGDREIKAKKIEAVLANYMAPKNIAGLNVLDFGCGIGQIAEYFAKQNTLYCADVEDYLDVKNRKILQFVQLSSLKLPFEDRFFDIVLSNHVIEHVKDQKLYLSEIHRVLKNTGVCYLATPNNNFFLEPHHRIPFINYLPRPTFHGILGMLGKYREELYLLSYRGMWSLFREQEFETIEYTAKILKHPEQYHLNLSFLKYVPESMLEILISFSPTNIFVLKKVE